MPSEKKRNRKNIQKNKTSQFDYLISLEKEYKKNTQTQITIPYTISEGDMGTVKEIDSLPQLNGNFKQV